MALVEGVGLALNAVAESAQHSVRQVVRLVHPAFLEF